MGDSGECNHISEEMDIALAHVAERLTVTVTGRFQRRYGYVDSGPPQQDMTL